MSSELLQKCKCRKVHHGRMENYVILLASNSVKCAVTAENINVQGDCDK